MAEKVRCEFCDRNFKNQDGLEAHNKAKHPEQTKKSKKPLPVKKIKNYSILIIVLGLLIWGVVALVGSSGSCKTDPVTEINIGSHNNLVSHIHPNLRIVIEGVPQIIPANIGVSTNIMRPLHTHDSTGKIHAEGPCQRNFVLGDFFLIWGEEFNSENILGHKAEEGTITMSVNGKKSEEYEKLVLRDSDNIVIEYIGN
jgi:hypothetical protein